MVFCWDISLGNQIELIRKDRMMTYGDFFQVNIMNVEVRSVIVKYNLYSSKGGRILNVTSNVMYLNNITSSIDLKDYLNLRGDEFSLKDTLPEDVYSLNIQLLGYPSYQLLYSMNENITVKSGDNRITGKVHLNSTEFYAEGNYDQFSSSERLFYNNYIRGGIGSKVEFLNIPFHLEAGTLYQFDDNSFMLDRLSIEFDYLSYLEKKKQQAMEYVESKDIYQLRSIYDSLQGISQLTEYDSYEIKSAVEGLNNYQQVVSDIGKTEYAQYFEVYEKYKEKLSNDRLDSLSKYMDVIRIDNKKIAVDTSVFYSKYGRGNIEHLNELLEGVDKDPELVHFLKKYNNKQNISDFKKTYERYRNANSEIKKYQEKYSFLKDKKLSSYHSPKDKEELKQMIGKSEDISFISRFSDSRTFQLADFKEIKIGFFYPNQENVQYSVHTPLLGYSVLYNRKPWIFSSYFGTSKVLSSTINKFYKEAFKKTGAYQGEFGAGVGDISKKAVLLNYTIINRTDTSGSVNKNMHIIGLKSILKSKNNRCHTDLRYDYYANRSHHNLYRNSSLNLSNSFKISRYLIIDQILYYKGADFFNPSLFLYADYEVRRLSHSFSGALGKLIPSWHLQHHFETVKNDTSAYINNNVAVSVLLAFSNQTNLLLNHSIGHSTHGIREKADKVLNYASSVSFIRKFQLKKRTLDIKVNASLQQSLMYDYNRDYSGPMVVDYNSYKKSFSYLLNVTQQITFDKVNYTQSVLFNKSEIGQQSFKDILSSSTVSMPVKNNVIQLQSSLGCSIGDEFLYSFRTTFLMNAIKNIKINTMLEYGKQRIYWPEIHYENGLTGNVSLYITM